MKICTNFVSRMKYFTLLLTGILVISLNVNAQGDWFFGLGTGPMRLNSKGDQGFHVLHPAIAAPVELDIDFTPEDISDLTASAFGFGGYATDGKWMIQYSFGQLKLEDEPRSVLPLGATLSTEIGFDITGGELFAGYPVYQGSSLTVRLHGGVRYTKHELENKITHVAAGGVTTRLKRNIDEDWTDVIFGVSADLPIAEDWIWSSRVDAGFGGSDGTYLVYTGVTWRFHEHWSGTLYGKFTAVDFENGSKGDTDWYLYDVDEFGPGITILYHW